jgi:SAM-dependent methyltransferase
MKSRQLTAMLPRRVRRPLGSARRWLRALPPRTQRQRQDLLAHGRLTDAQRELLGRVQTRISYKDGMYFGNGDHYFKVGLSAIDCIDEALAQAGNHSIGTILDLPCGYGRVLRFLVQRFPEAKITGCELARQAVQFCAQTFAATAAYSNTDLRELSFDTRFDLIWCGSLVTHLDQSGIVALMDLFRRTLSPGGLVVITTHGDRVVKQMVSNEFDYAIAKETIPAITSSYRKSGYGFTDYPDLSAYDAEPGSSGYGVSLTSPDWIRIQAAQVGGLREVYFQPHGWDDHQDVFGFVLQD